MEVNTGRLMWPDYWADTFVEVNLGRLIDQIWGDICGKRTKRNVAILIKY